MSNTEETVLRKDRGGRPRDVAAPRDEHGRIAASHYREDPRTLAQWNKARDLMMQLGLSARLSTQRGMLFCTRQINSVEFETANRWSDMLDTNDRIVLGKRRTPAPPAFERMSAGEAAGYSPERVDRFLKAFKAAHDVVLTAGKLAEAALNRLCRDEASAAVLPDAKKALAPLAMHFGLVKKRRPSS